MNASPRALLLDLDGTLLDREGRIRPRTRESVLRAADRGVRVMIATGRSLTSTLPVLEELALDSLAVIFNGAAVWSPQEGRLIEERVLANRTVERALAFGAEHDLLTVTMCARYKCASEPRDEVEREALRGLTGLEVVPREALPTEYLVRVTLFSPDERSDALAARLERRIARPVHLTHFPLRLLPMHRDSPMAVVDVHPPCRGKAEALRVLEEHYGIAPAEVVAVGDASNDVEMLREAGLGVAMGDGMEEARRAADRVIGGCDSDALADLVDELFGT